MAQGTGDDGENNIDIYVNIGRKEEAFARKIARKIQELITTAGEVEDNYILCIAKEFNNADIEELMQDVIFYRGKCIHLIFLTVDFEESKGGNLEDIIIKEQVAIKVYKKTY